MVDVFLLDFESSWLKKIVSWFQNVCVFEYIESLKKDEKGIYIYFFPSVFKVS